MFIESPPHYSHNQVQPGCPLERSHVQLYETLSIKKWKCVPSSKCVCEFHIIVACEEVHHSIT